MPAPTVEQIAASPIYQELKAKRTRIGWILTALMMIVYYGFIVLIAFDKEWLAQRIGTGVTTLGMPVGLAVIIFTILITAYYVRRANGEFDDLTAKLQRGELK